jgi:hypothetical protein
MYFRGGKRFRETRFSGYAPGIYVPLYLPGRPGYKLAFYDSSDNKIGEMGSDSYGTLVEEVAFELLESGCGSMELVLADKPPFEIEYRTRVDIFPFFSPDPWYTGFIYDLPSKSAKTKEQRYQGYGYYDQLDWVLVSGAWQNKKASEIMADIMENQAAPKTQIKYNEAKIIESTTVISSFSVDRITAKDALTKLGEFEPSFIWGVDNFREFFFFLRSNLVTAKLWVGKHCEDIEIEEQASQIKNRLYIKAGLIQNGSNILAVVEDQDSISKYGVREAVLTAPEIFSAADAENWGYQKLSELKLKKLTGTAKNIFLEAMKPIEPKGKVIIVNEEGTEREMRIIKVDYTINASSMLATMKLESYE